MVDVSDKSRIEVPERGSANWDRAIAVMGLEAQVQLLPYALGFFGICLPIFITAAYFAPNAPWLLFSMGIYAFNWAAYYAVLDWRRKHPLTLNNVRRHTAVHIAGGSLWAVAILQTAAFAQSGGPVAETLLVLCVGAAVGVIFFSAPSLPSLLVVGPLAAAGPLLALRLNPETATTGQYALCGIALALALALILNKHLHGHFALALEREGLIIEREGALEKTRRLAKSKSDILATLSHEIRNGLSGVAHVLGGALGAGSRGSPSRDQLKAALSATRDLVEVLDATLDSEVAESGRLSLQLRSIDAGQLAQDIVLLHRGAANAKRLQIIAHVDPRLAGLSGSTVGDSARVRQILNNLVANAVKYTVRGQVEMRVFKPNGSHVRFEVVDTGPGLTASELAMAFEPFQRVARTGGGVAGAGLGLALSRRLAIMMQGDLNAESVLGVGSRFWLDLPWDTQAELSEPISSAEVAPTARHLKILVAEDDPLNAAMLRAVLEQLGHKVLAASDGRRALELLRMGDLDLIMADGRMPNMDGPTMIRALRTLPGAVAETPVVAVTGGDADEVQSMMDAGADAVLRKPVTVNAVGRAVADAMRSASDPASRKAVA